MRITETQLRNVIREQLAAGKRAVKTLKSRRQAVRVQMTPAQAAAFAVFPKGLGAEGYYGSAGFDFYVTGGQVKELTWSKRGGYADKMKYKTFDALKALGFKEKDQKQGGSPDGSYHHSGITFVDPEGNEFTWNSSYGVTSHDNGYYAKLKFATPLQVVDAEEAAMR